MRVLTTSETERTVGGTISEYLIIGGGSFGIMAGVIYLKPFVAPYLGAVYGAAFMTFIASKIFPADNWSDKTLYLPATYAGAVFGVAFGCLVAGCE